MIKKIVKREVKEVETKTEEMYCDFCGKKADRCDWSDGTYRLDDTEIRVSIRHKRGECYPECSWGTLTRVDLCPECFQNVLMPFIVKNSKERRIFDEEYDY